MILTKKNRDVPQKGISHTSYLCAATLPGKSNQNVGFSSLGRESSPTGSVGVSHLYWVLHQIVDVSRPYGFDSKLWTLVVLIGSDVKLWTLVVPYGC